MRGMPRKTIEERRQYDREWRAKNPDKVRANQLRALPYYRARRAANLPLFASYAAKWRLKNPKQRIITNARSRAKKRGIAFEVDVDTIAWPTHCPVLGIELDYTGQDRTRTTLPTLDRRDNSLGYVLGNVFIISHRANRIKSDATIEELEAIVRYAGFSNS